VTDYAALVRMKADDDTFAAALASINPAMFADSFVINRGQPFATGMACSLLSLHA
jgi:hypothetical protein